MKNMINKSYLILSLLFILGVVSCSKDYEYQPSDVTTPTNLSIQVMTSADQVGAVTVTPSAEGAATFQIDYGDGSAIDEINIGQSAKHNYAEGAYTIKVRAINILGESIEATQNVNVAFDPPMNLVVDINIDAVNTNVVTVTPTAENAMLYEIYFGDVADEVPTVIMSGSAVHTYSEAGNFEVKVIAKSGSINTLEYRETIEIFIPAAQLSLPIDFENPDIDYVFTSFGNANVVVADNPDKTGINTSNRVAHLNKAPGAEVWAGGFLELPNPIDFSTQNQITLDVWSPKAGAAVLIKLENFADNTINHEVQMVTTTSNAWESLSFNFSNIDQSNTYSRIVVFMDFGVNGDGSDYYYDNIRLGTGGGMTGGGDDKIELPVDFENMDITYTFENFGNANTNVINNPDATGINTSSRVGHLNKGAGAEIWAGSFIELDGPIDFSNSTTITMKSWSPKAGIQVLMKLENLANGGDINYEIPTTTVNADEWETLSFDFSGIDQSNTYGRIVIFYDFGNTGDDTDYYFDDINLQ